MAAKENLGVGNSNNLAKISPGRRSPNSRPRLIFRPAAGLSSPSDRKKLSAGRQFYLAAAGGFSGERNRSPDKAPIEVSRAMAQ